MKIFENTGGNGSLQLNSVAIQNVKIKLSNGSIDIIGKCKFEDLFVVTSSNGSISIDDKVIFLKSNNVEITSSNGSIYVPKSLAIKKAKTSNGKVLVSKTDIGAILKTSNGSIKYSNY